MSVQIIIVIIMMQDQQLNRKSQLNQGKAKRR